MGNSVTFGQLKASFLQIAEKLLRASIPNVRIVFEGNPSNILQDLNWS